MGMADVIPGVSGGTIAFITGIYQELIDSIGKVDARALQVLLKEGPIKAFKYVNGPFLASLFLGIGVSLVALARSITHLLDTYPVLVWSFFFGLIVASAFYIGRNLAWKKAGEVIPFILGAVVAYFISTATPSGSDVGLLYVFFSGAIAICAMILPGISGSFILLLMGSYATIFGAIGHVTDDFGQHLPVIAAFGTGAVIGLLSFAKLLRYLFAEHENKTIAVLTGFMLGSLGKVWPWKEIISTRINSKGKEVPLLEENVLPDRFLELTGADPQVLLAALMALVGILIVFLLSRVDTSQQEEK